MPIRELAKPRKRRRELSKVSWPLLGYVPAAVVFARTRRKWSPPRPLSVAVAYGAPAAVWRALPQGRLRVPAVWATHMWAYKVAFAVAYDQPEKMRARLHIDEPIKLDSALAGGIPPTQRLQRALRKPPDVNALDYALTLVYTVWEAEPHLSLAWILLRHPERFPAAVLRLAATFDATLVGYYAYPSAPPWWASEREGRMDREVRRVAPEAMKELRGKPRPGIDHNSGANPWAAMPSDHFASALSTALFLTEADRRAGAAGATYAAALGFALVYLGEHYVSDLIAGAALALAIHAAHGAVEGPLTKSLRLAVAPGPKWRRILSI